MGNMMMMIITSASLRCKVRGYCIRVLFIAAHVYRINISCLCGPLSDSGTVSCDSGLQ
jgi:hypothetical protein